MLSLNNLKGIQRKYQRKLMKYFCLPKLQISTIYFHQNITIYLKLDLFNTTQYAPFAYLCRVRMYTENDEQHMTLNKWISKSRTLSTATMKSTNTEHDDIFNLRMSTFSVYTDTDQYQIYRSWLDGGNHYISMPNQNYFSEYEFDCINLSKFSFCTAWESTGRCGRSCEIVVYIDGIEMGRYNMPE